MTDPPRPLGLSDFFALEAGEYLERLDALLGRPDAGAGAEELVRLARALRGSALMANQQPIARVASALESVARAVREGRRSWDEATKQLAIHAVDDLKIFVRRAPGWSDADTAKADALAAQLDQLAGRPSAQLRAAEALGLDAGARAFVAREGAAIASALDRAAQVLRVNPLAHDPLQHVLKALQPLRGLAAVGDLPPLPDLLDGIERVIGELTRTAGSRPADTPELFQAAGTAIAQAARGVADRGRPDPESPEFKHFAGLLVQFLETEPGIVTISSLYFDDGGPHIVERGTPAARPATLGRLEVVSHGEHLRQAADSLERAPSATQRELRAHTLAGTFRALAEVGGGPLAERLAEFAMAARDAVSLGVATAHPAAFAAELRRAGDVLVRSSTEDETALAGRLAEVTSAVGTLASGAGAAPATSAPTMTEEPVAESRDIVGSWAAYEQFVATGVGPASLDELLAGGSARAPRAPAPARAAPPAPPSYPPSRPSRPSRPSPTAPARSAPAEPTVVDIRSLLYRGERALQRAQELREQAKHASGEQLRGLVEEVCDLVALALEPGP